MKSPKAQLIRTIYKQVYKPALFRRDPEEAHDRMLRLGHGLGNHTLSRAIVRGFLHYSHPSLEQTIHRINFKNPVGLSAGFDKDANLMSIMPSVGFGFMEVGTITCDPYEGNLGKRLVRLPKSRAIIVNYGLKNLGSRTITAKLAHESRPIIPMVISIGKTNCREAVDTRTGIRDYFMCLKRFVNAKIGDIYDINISCPNVFGGEPFTTQEKLDSLLSKIGELNITKPMFLKMPSDKNWEEFSSLLDVAVKHGVQGVIISNLSKDRSSSDIKDDIDPQQKGGISGKPVSERSNEFISKTYASYGDKLTIIGVGGIFSAEDAYEKIKRGASLVQLITGMIYEGPQLIGEINRGLVQLLKKDRYSNINQAIGAYHP
ncbi:dihydroorotate dehydrogenase (quinone) [bacterium]|mgnify:CR=1 FL=1|jgi:dihydroorotate dehydrogenase subfamily 2|nr:dihydroorotate dehydrogenase (quinone) [bacterium]MDP6756386.1 quinone-dependent dihydroorotate dehydrogenase [Patescibacteria group bacterium]|tara:strand:- start:7993 stop:9114 length:1122 start_codon:yes stop_codon:yes gene_type:complete